MEGTLGVGVLGCGGVEGKEGVGRGRGPVPGVAGVSGSAPEAPSSPGREGVGSSSGPVPGSAATPSPALSAEEPASAEPEARSCPRRRGVPGGRGGCGRTRARHAENVALLVAVGAQRGVVEEQLVYGDAARTRDGAQGVPRLDGVGNVALRALGRLGIGRGRARAVEGVHVLLRVSGICRLRLLQSNPAPLCIFQYPSYEGRPGLVRPFRAALCPLFAGAALWYNGKNEKRGGDAHGRGACGAARPARAALHG